MSWAVSARVLTLKVIVMLITIGIILMLASRVPWVWSACLRGLYMLYIWAMKTWAFPFVYYLHSMICSCLLPRKVGSLMRWPLVLVVYPIAVIRSGLWCTGMWCVDIMYSIIVCGWYGVLGLSSWRPSWSGCNTSNKPTPYLPGLRLNSHLSALNALWMPYFHGVIP